MFVSQNRKIQGEIHVNAIPLYQDQSQPQLIGPEFGLIHEHNKISKALISAKYVNFDI